MIDRASSRHGPVGLLCALLVLLLVGGILAVHLAARAGGAGASACDRFAADAAVRGALVTGTGPRVVVIGDSWSVGLGLSGPRASWPTRLPGQVHVSGFSGSGFSEGAGCPGASFADRTAGAVRGGADLVVVQGGLNDHDQPAADVRAGFRRLLAAVGDHPVVVVGPAAAPSRAAAAARVDRLLARLCARHGVTYLGTTGWDLPYLADDLHLTPAGHHLFGDAVARALP